MKCDYIGCSNESVKSVSIAPGTVINVCTDCLKLIDNPTVEPSGKYVCISVTAKDLPIKYPEKFEEVTLLQWDNAGILIPWKKGDSAHKAIIRWAIKELLPEND